MKKILKSCIYGLSFGITFLIVVFVGNIIINARSGTNNLIGSDKDTLTSTKRNQLLNKFDAAIGRSGPDSLTAGSGDKLTTTKWNALANKVNTYANTPTCSNDSGGNCNINVANKLILEPNLLAGNIKSGATIFGIAGTLVGNGYSITVQGTTCPTGFQLYKSYNVRYSVGSVAGDTCCYGCSAGGCRPTSGRYTTYSVCYIGSVTTYLAQCYYDGRSVPDCTPACEPGFTPGASFSEGNGSVSFGACTPSIIKKSLLCTHS